MMKAHGAPHGSLECPVVKLYAEVGTDGGALLYVFDPPGLVARGRSLPEALERAPDGYAELAEMRVNAAAAAAQPAAGAGAALAPTVNYSFVIAEQVNRRGAVADGMTSATFGPDFVPVSADELPGIVALLGESRRRLLEVRTELESAGLPGLMDYRSLPHRMTIRRQLEHIASAEKWYLSHIWTGLSRLAPARDIWQRLEAVRAQVIAVLETEGKVPQKAASVSGERWTVRKVVRRLMYHEKFHRDAVRRDLDLARREAGQPG